MKKNGFVEILVLLLVVGVAGFFVVKSGLIKPKLPGMAPSQTQPQKATGIIDLSLKPSQQTISKGQTFTATVDMDAKTEKVSAAEIHVSFDPKQLEASSIKAGSILPVVLAPGTVGKGTATITLGSSPNHPVSGTGTVATITFKALANTTSATITLDPTTQVAAVGKQDNMVGKLNSSQITISNP